MNDEFYAVIKLVSGEEIFGIVSPTEDQGIEYLIVSHPIKIVKSLNDHGIYIYSVKPWLELTSESLFFLEKSRLITVNESFDAGMIKLYKSYLHNVTSDGSGNYKLNRDEGYVSNVKEARLMLEKIYQSNIS